MCGPFVPGDYIVPTRLDTARFTLRPLVVSDMLKDYDAVMTSLDHLQGIFGSRSSWPARDLSLEQEIIDLAWHQKEFQRRSSFTYTVVSSDESRCLGCLYIFPSAKAACDAEIYMWVRQDEYEQGLDSELYGIVRDWIRADWPFKSAKFPGRDTSWEDWGTLA